ncbi:MAG TPA: 50S ribosomal protein L23 [Bacteroidota bacterium]|nr:50S ribosomal protein L23 [Bacteroidota bacterium]
MLGILYRPIVTEKITKLNEIRQYAFEVEISANKISIAKAVEGKFHVTVTKVRTMMVKGKTKTQMTKKGRFAGTTRHYKKAVVTLKEGDKIDFFENV